MWIDISMLQTSNRCHLFLHLPHLLPLVLLLLAHPRRRRHRPHYRPQQVHRREVERTQITVHFFATKIVECLWHENENLRSADLISDHLVFLWRSLACSFYKHGKSERAFSKPSQFIVFAMWCDNTALITASAQICQMQGFVPGFIGKASYSNS